MDIGATSLLAASGIFGAVGGSLIAQHDTLLGLGCLVVMTGILFVREYFKLD